VAVIILGSWDQPFDIPTTFGKIEERFLWVDSMSCSGGFSLDNFVGVSQLMS